MESTETKKSDNLLITKKPLKKELTLEEEWEKWRKEYREWKQKSEESAKRTEEYYKQNPGGSIFYHWDIENDANMQEYFMNRAQELFRRQEREKKKSSLEESKKQKPRVVKARLDIYNEQTKE